MSGTEPKRTFLREWRKYRRLTLDELGARIGVTHGTLSKIERGLLPYSQRQLEDLARELGTTPASLLARNPHDPDGVWEVWDRIPPRERHRAIRMLKALTDDSDAGAGG